MLCTVLLFTYLPVQTSLPVKTNYRPRYFWPFLSHPPLLMLSPFSGTSVVIIYLTLDLLAGEPVKKQLFNEYSDLPPLSLQSLLKFLFYSTKTTVY